VRYVDLDGVRVSSIGLGTWQFGSREWGYGDAYATDVAPALVRRALELGITFIDTAEAYGFGRSERIVGTALDGSREAAFIATKLLPLLPLPSIVGRQARASRRRLGIDSIDLYQVHWPNPLVPARTTMRGLRRLIDDGVVERVGVSNHSLAGWRLAERALRRPVVSNQVRFSLANPAPRWDLVPYARERGRVVVAYSPLGQGALSAWPAAPGEESVRDGGPLAAPDDASAGTGSAGRPAAPDASAAVPGRDGRRPAGIRRMNPLFTPKAAELARPLRSLVGDIAAAHGATPAQVALAWVIGHGNVVAIPGARTIEQLEENAAAADLDLSPDEHARLSAAADRFDAAMRA
jgi:aryl-alcohol dehydrogenase-like predicted oxidoreductase